MRSHLPWVLDLHSAWLGNGRQYRLAPGRNTLLTVSKVRLGFVVTSVFLFLTGVSLDAQDNIGGANSWRAPLRSRNQLPPALFFGHLAPDRARVLTPGTTMWRLDFDYSNILRKSIAGQELLWLDAEYLRAELGASFGLPHDFEVGVAVPGFLYTGGFLDPVIDGFHNLLNWIKLPGGSTTVRRRTVDGQLRYEYRRPRVLWRCFAARSPASPPPRGRRSAHPERSSSRLH